ncbi:hypothetical protein ATY35_03610 [Vibrio cidicii]|uniref:Uncharacterized protein n=1 Tax=Vibrio cidicii TaxID=1763883 RepID=A0ABR5VZW3_9VIBR|nr:hypothetical protein ATY35_03610 [Vibrio cidicii]
MSVLHGYLHQLSFLSLFTKSKESSVIFLLIVIGARQVISRGDQQIEVKNRAMTLFLQFLLT